jgi:glycosyltransferase involved in cell wall biosynthesis
MEFPLVTVICLCYNHERFIREAVESVLHQTYKNIEIIIVDDCSTDGSQTIIRDLVQKHPQLFFLPLPANSGNCRAFNKGLQMARGNFVVDFSTDDVMMPQRIEKQVACFSTLPRDFGVVFTDVLYIDEASNPLYQHFDYLFKNKLLRKIPEGDVYTDILRTYFVSSPSMLVKREVFDFLKGYDESLAYEDFDFWVRSARKFRYALLKEVLTKVRKTGNSLSTRAYVRGSLQVHSTYQVCRKAVSLNRTDEDKKALIQRVRYEHRHAVLSGNYVEAEMFFNLLKQIADIKWSDHILKFLGQTGLSFSGLRKFYQKMRYRN